MGFARSQCFGKCGAAAIRTVSRIAAGDINLLNDDLMAHLHLWPSYLRNAKPRRITAEDEDTMPEVVFIDGAEEEAGELTQVVSVGGVYAGQNGTRQSFALDLHSDEIEGWKKISEKTVSFIKLSCCLL